MFLEITAITSLTTAKQIAKPSKTRENVPNVVNAPAPLFAVGSQNKVSNPDKNSLAKSVINPNPSLMALIIAVPMCCPPIT